MLEDKDYRSCWKVLPHGSAFVAVAPTITRAARQQAGARHRWTGQDLLGCSACVNPYVARDMADALAHARSRPRRPHLLVRQSVLRWR
ncbi:MAG: hypothetical protein ACLTMP_03705 [Eggerthella lenta]